MRKTLLLFTASYPFSVAAENGFIPQELGVLRNYFETVVLIPTKTGGERDTVAAPNVVVNTGFAEFRASRIRRTAYALRSFVDPRFLGEVLSKLGTIARRPIALVSMLRQHVIARMTERWIQRFADARWSDVVLYTWWFDGTTLGLARFANRNGVPVITRAHGSDLYEARHDPPYLPFRAQSLERVRLVFSASEAGARYLSSTYPGVRGKIRVSLLGVTDPEFTNQRSADGVFRMLSCSFCLPVKRIDLTIRGIAALGRAHPDQLFEWTHIGDGPERDSLGALANATMPPNVRHQLLPYPGQKGLLEYYRTHPVDLFINTSSSEGTPVTIMEAISVGIPVVATSVGGNVEIVTSENGVALSADPDPQEIASVITRLMCDEAGLTRMRAGSKEKWQREYSAQRNYGNFAAAIREL